MSDGPPPALILICGPSGSGKSTLAQQLAEQLQAVVVHQDHYFLKTFVRYRDRVDDTFEGPENVDWPRLREDVMWHLQQTPVVAEGHLLAVDQELISAAKLCVILHCTAEVCRSRRLNRRQRPEEELEELADYIDKFVWPSFLQYGQPALTSLEKFCSEAGKPLRVLDASLEPAKLVEEASDGLRVS
ncbi:udk [Symbiodinium sp. CCMP2592]|nr:udk [Symbiodinium sp. CCMP2592]